MSRLRPHHHKKKAYQLRRHQKEEIARKNHREWLKKHREARAQEPYIIRGLISERGGLKWRTIRVKRPPRIKKALKEIEIISPTVLQVREKRRMKIILLTILAPMAIVIAAVGGFFLIASGK